MAFVRMPPLCEQPAPIKSWQKEELDKLDAVVALSLLTHDDVASSSGSVGKKIRNDPIQGGGSDVVKESEKLEAVVSSLLSTVQDDVASSGGLVEKKKMLIQEAVTLSFGLVKKPEILSFPKKGGRRNYTEDPNAKASLEYAKELVLKAGESLDDEKLKFCDPLLKMVGKESGIPVSQLYKFFRKDQNKRSNLDIGQGRPSLVNDDVGSELLNKYGKREYKNSEVIKDVMEHTGINAEQARQWVSRTFKNRVNTWRRANQTIISKTRKVRKTVG